MDEQMVLRKGRSCSDNVFMLKQIIGKQRIPKGNIFFI
jgi:hypothetical protein